MAARRIQLFRGALVAGCLGALLGGTGLAFGDGPGSYAEESVATGTGQSGDEAISQVLQGVSGTAVRSASLTEASGVRVQVDSDQSDDLYAVWLGGLVQGAVADRMRDEEETTDDVVRGGQVEDTDESGEPVTVRLGTGSVVGGQVFHSPSDDELASRAKAAARRFGLELLSVEVMHPLESAISARFALPDDGELTWTIEDLRSAVAGSPLSVEGVFIEIVSPSGMSLLRTGASYRTGEGGLSFAPGQDDRFGAVHGHLGSLPAVK